MQFHYKPDPKKARKPVPRAAAEGPQPVSAAPAPSADPGVFIMNSPVLTGQLDQSLLQPGLLGQAVLPASVSGGPRVLGAQGEAAGRLMRCVHPASSVAALPEIFPGGSGKMEFHPSDMLSFRVPFSLPSFLHFTLQLFGLLGLNLFVS